VTELVSISSTGVQGDRDSVMPAISPDGRYVAFEGLSGSFDPNLPVGGVFLRDRQTGTLVSVSVNSAGASADGSAYAASVSGDGRFVAFTSHAANLGVSNPNHFPNVFVRDSQAGTTICADVDSSGNPGTFGAACPAISADGRYVVFQSSSGNLVPGDAFNTSDVFRYDIQTGSMVCASVDSAGAFGNSGSGRPAVSADGRFVAFVSDATNLESSDTNGTSDAFVHDFQSGSTRRVSVGSLGEEANSATLYDPHPSISGDGSRVAFVSLATNLVPSDANASPDIVVHDITTGQTMMVNLDSSGGQTQYTYTFSLSGNGRFVAFTSDSRTLVPGDSNGSYDVFLRDLQAGITTRESVSGSGGQGNLTSMDPVMSEDGRLIAFDSFASQLVSGDTNGVVDIFIHDRAPSTATSFCLGDTTGAACPCGNRGGPFRGCENSASTGGAVLGASGITSLSNDMLRITSFGERASVLSVFLQGTTTITPANYGDGLRCIGGTLERLYARNARLGVVTAPQGADLSISARSAALGDSIPAGATRYYQVYYRDPAITFCPDPPGNSWNVSNALSVVWDP
jgi:Tol biopolymer transport system component